MPDPDRDDQPEITGADRPDPDPRHPHRYQDDPDDGTSPWFYAGFQT